MYFSVIIPVYNTEAYLGKCLDSILSQDFADWEAICVNDGSTDGSAAILTDYAARNSRLRVVHQPNRGLSVARNTGLNAAQGDYILFVDSDDWIAPHALSTLAPHLSIKLDMLCFGGQRYEEAKGTLLPDTPLLPTFYSNGMDYYNANVFTSRKFPFVCVVLRCYRRQFLIENNLRFREGILHEDNHFTPRACLAASAVRVIPDVLYNYRVRQGSIMTTRGLRSKECLILIANELSATFAAAKNINRQTVYQALTQYYQMAFADGNRQDDRQLLPLIDWTAYRRVSRTKLRHRVNYAALRLSPVAFRALCKLMR